MIKVHETNPAGGDDLETYYGYDLAGRLSRVNVGGQERVFDYDHRGFLLSEKHPEIGAHGSGTLTYGDYDSRGNAGFRLLGGGFDHEYRYDRAGRLTQVLQPGDPLPLKEYFYGRENGFGKPVNLQVGKLVQTKRRNWVKTLGLEEGATSDIVVTESFAYREGSGALTDHEIRSSDGQIFHQSMSYDSLGNVSTLNYPDCLHPADCAAALPSRQLSHGYRQGFLTAIPGYLDDVLYHSNGLWSQVDRANGTFDHQELYGEASGPFYLSLPGRIYTPE